MRDTASSDSRATIGGSVLANPIETEELHLTPDSHPDNPTHLHTLGMSLLRRYEQVGDISDLENACAYLEQAVELAPDGHLDKLAYLNDLGSSLNMRFEQLGNLTDIDKAIEYASRAVELTPSNHSGKPGCLNGLGNSLLLRFKQLGSIADIFQAIECQSQAVALAPDGHSDKPSCLESLGIAWQIQFEQFGNLTNLDKAIECLSRAAELTPEDHPSKPRCLNNFGISWQSRFERLGNITDLEKGIECTSQAVELTPEGHPLEPVCLNTLAGSLKSRFERLGSPADLDNAIKCASRAVELAPDGHPDKSSQLNNLGKSLQSRFKRLGNLADSDKAIECLSRAVELTPNGHPNKPGSLNELGILWQIRSERLENSSDLDKAIECLSRTVELTPDGHPAKPGRLNSLGHSWQRRFEQHGRTQDLETSIGCFQSGAELVVTSPSPQLECARQWAKHSLHLGRSPLSAYQRAFALLPHIVSLGQTIQARYDSILSISDLAAEAAAWAMSVEQYDLALEWLEQGRSVVWSRTLQLRTPFDELAKLDPALADRLTEVAFHLDGASSRSQVADESVEQEQELEYQAQRHRRLAEVWDQLLVEARRLHGFDGFVLPRTAADLKRAATDGPVVVLNIHSTRCDALVIFPESDDVTHIPLDSLADRTVTAACSQLISLVGRRGSSARGVKRAPLSLVESQDQLQPLVDLWLSVVRPVLDALAYTSKWPYDDRPHVTWCATGALAFLPLHAAGLYDGQSPNAFDLVISSYTPTLSALLPRSDQKTEPTRGVLAVGQVNTEGQPPLPMTVQELAIVKRHTNAINYHQLDGASATVKATLESMKQHGWVHFACHAVQNRDNPSHSAFHLHDGFLTLEEIAKQQFKNKGLAFLSACQTATGDDRLPDEATHLAAGMLTAGYPSVIATMWSIRDEDAPRIAEEVYAELMKDGAMDHTRTAIALHKAVGKLREKVGVESIDRWAPFIHVGV